MADRDDVWDGQKLTSIKVASSDVGATLLKDIRFEYGSFESTGSGWNPLISGWKSSYSQKRLKLLSVFNQKGSLTDSRHAFFYNDAVPNKYTYNVDYWGYYNGTSGSRKNTYLPDLSKLKWGRS